MCREDEGRGTAGVCEALSGRLHDVRPCEGIGQSDGQETKDGSFRTKVKSVEMKKSLAKPRPPRQDGTGTSGRRGKALGKTNPSVHRIPFSIPIRFNQD